jgi:tetratricopeptide (TPR) repeat protein
MEKVDEIENFEENILTEEELKETENFDENILTEEELKELGNEAFNVRDYQSALHYYQKAIKIKPNEILYANLSVTYEQLKNYEKSLEEAEKSIDFNKDWWKGILKISFIKDILEKQ